MCVFVNYSFPHRREKEKCFKDGTSGICVSMRSYLYLYSSNFPLYEFARFISAGRFVKHFCQRIVEYPDNSNTKNAEDARDVGHKKKNILPTVAAWRESNRGNFVSLATAAAPLARASLKKRLSPSLEGNCYLRTRGEPCRVITQRLISLLFFLRYRYVLRSAIVAHLCANNFPSTAIILGTKLEER